MDLANAELQSLVDRGDLHRDEYERMVIPTYNRTPAEFRAPFADGPATSDLQLISAEEAVLDDPFWATYQSTPRCHGVRCRRGGLLPGRLRTLAVRSPRRARSEQELDGLAAAFYAGLGDRVEADPATARCDWRIVNLHIAKRDD